MKKKVPLAILEIFQSAIDKNSDTIETKKNENSLFCCIDKDENSDFYFKVMKCEFKNGSPSYILEYKPKSNHQTEAVSVALPFSEIPASLERWISIIKSYNSINTIYDDPILKTNQKKFEESFHIEDEDADYASFDLSQQIFNDDYLKNVKIKLLALQEGKAESEVKELNLAIDNATEIQQQLTKETKNQVIKRLAKFWAQTQKIGLEVIKEIFVNVAAELTKRLITGGK